MVQIQKVENAGNITTVVIFASLLSQSMCIYFYKVLPNYLPKNVVPIYTPTS